MLGKMMDQLLLISSLIENAATTARSFLRLNPAKSLKRSYRNFTTARSRVGKCQTV